MGKQLIAGLLATSALAALLCLRSSREKSNSPEFIIVGDTFVDILVGPVDCLPTWGGDALVGDPIILALGGTGANVAVHVAGAVRRESRKDGRPRSRPCRLVSATGRDTFGNFVRDELRRCGVVLHESSGARGGAVQGTCVVISGKDDRSFLTHRGITSQLRCSELRKEKFGPLTHLHLSGFYNVPHIGADAAEIFERAVSSGATTSLTPQYDATERWDRLDPLYRLLTFLILNELEAEKISGCCELPNAAEFFLKGGVKHVVVTRGSEGASLYCLSDGVPSARHQKCRSVKVVDTTGAGDAFAAGFLHAWKRTGSIDEALRVGCAHGTACVQIKGACPTDHFTEEDILNSMA